MMATTMTMKTVGELAVENPNATRVFERYGIDYCCGGHKPLADACESAKVPVEDVLNGIAEAEKSLANSAIQKDWSKEPLSALIDHINSTHHVYVREEVPRILRLIEKVVAAHGENHKELLVVQGVFSELGQELFMHLMKEEQILFPYVKQAEQSQKTSCSAPHSCFGTVQNPIRMMMMEHDSAGVALRDMREVTSNYAIPADACISYKTLYQALQAFEKDLHQHIHLENNILFPRAAEMEE